MANVLAKYNKPVFGADAAFVCQINVDYRVIRSNLNTSRKYDEDGATLAFECWSFRKKACNLIVKSVILQT